MVKRTQKLYDTRKESFSILKQVLSPLVLICLFILGLSAEKTNVSVLPNEEIYVSVSITKLRLPIF